MLVERILYSADNTPCSLLLCQPASPALPLPQDVAGLGEAGQLAKVNQGYARNFLVPRKLVSIRRGKQSGAVAGWSPPASAGGGREGGSPATGSADDEALRRQQEAHARRRLEAVVKKLTTVPVVR